MKNYNMVLTVQQQRNLYYLQARQINMSTIQFMKQRTIIQEAKFYLLPSKHSSLEDVFKTSRSRRLYLPLACIFRILLQEVYRHQYIRFTHTSSRRFQNVFKTYSKGLAKTCSRSLQDVFKTSLKNVFLFILIHIFRN